MQNLFPYPGAASLVSFEVTVKSKQNIFLCLTAYVTF